MPTSRELAQWLIEQELEPEKGIGVKRINRSEHDSRFYLLMDGEEMVEKIMEAIGKEGRVWKDEKSGQIRNIKARKEGEQWMEVKISNIQQDTDRKQVETYFGYFGEIKDFKQDEMHGMVLDSATIKVKLKEGAVIPAYLVVKGVPGDMEAGL